jgi:hypothetical protein
VLALLVDVVQVRAAFSDWRIVARGKTWRAIRRQSATSACSGRFAALGRPELTVASLDDLAIQLAALEYSLGITPMS